MKNNHILKRLYIKLSVELFASDNCDLDFQNLEDLFVAIMKITAIAFGLIFLRFRLFHV